MTWGSASAGFARLLNVLLPRGGGVMALIEGYFDESGGSDTKSGVLCIAGYILTSDRAASLDAAWAEVLAEHQLPFFHMVDCAHGAAPFHNKDKDERSSIARKLIDLVKGHVTEGFAFITDRETYKLKSGKEQDAYSYAARMAVNVMKFFIDANRLTGDMACFFEAGHASQGRAYAAIAEEMRSGLNASVTFHGKTQLRLLQAADLLAWQVLKYVNDARSQARPPRKDFLSLMEHPHSFFHVGSRDGELTMGIELWPLRRRAQRTSMLQSERPNGPLPYFVEEGEGIPILVPGNPIGWRIGGLRMAYIKFHALADKTKEFYIALDPPNLVQTGLSMLSSASALGESVNQPLPAFRSELFSASHEGDRVILTLQIPSGGKFRFSVSRESWEAASSLAPPPQVG